MLRSAIQPLGTDLGTIARQALGGVRERAVAIGDLKPGQGTVKTELRENAVGLPGMLMQGIAAIAPSCAILAAWRTPTSDSTRRVLNGTCPWDIVKILAAPLARVRSSGYQTTGG
jgi:hypothetical protein